MQETQYTESVSNTDNNDIGILLYKIMEVIQRVNRSPILIGATMYPYDNGLTMGTHHRLLLRFSGRLPHIQIQTVLVLIVKGGHLCLRLTGTFRIIIRLIDAVAGYHIHRRFPTQTANRLLAYIRDAPEDDGIIHLLADKGSIDTLDCQRRVVVAIGDGFILAISGPYNLLMLCSLITRLPCRLFTAFARRQHRSRSANQDDGEHP